MYIIYCDENSFWWKSMIVMNKLWKFFHIDKNHQYYENLQLCWKCNMDTAMIVCY